MKKEVIIRLFLLIIQLIYHPTNHNRDWHCDDYHAMQKLFIPQRLMASGYFYYSAGGMLIKIIELVSHYYYSRGYAY